MRKLDERSVEDYFTSHVPSSHLQLNSSRPQLYLTDLYSALGANLVGVHIMGTSQISDADDSLLSQSFRDRQQTISAILTDSRMARPSGLYICMKGSHTDGHLYIEDVIQAGVQHVLVDESWYLTSASMVQTIKQHATIWIVKNTYLACADLAAAFYQYPTQAVRLIGLVGAFGKRSLSRWIDELTQQIGCTLGWVEESKIHCGDQTIYGTRNHLGAVEIQQTLSMWRHRGIQYGILPLTTEQYQHQMAASVEFACLIAMDERATETIAHQTMASLNACTISDLNLQTLKSCQISSINRLERRCDQIVFPLSDQTYVSIHHHGARTIQVDCMDMPDQTSLGGLNAYPFPILKDLTLLKLLATDVFGLTNETYEALRPRIVQNGFDAKTSQTDHGARLIVDAAWHPDQVAYTLSHIKPCVNGALWVIYGASGNRSRHNRIRIGQLCQQYADHVMLTVTHPRGESPVQILADLTTDLSCDYQTFEMREAAVNFAIEYAQSGDVILLMGKGEDDYEIRYDQVRMASDLNFLSGS